MPSHSSHPMNGSGDSTDRSENVKVVARCRPMNKKEEDSNCSSIVNVNPASKTITVDIPSSQSPMASTQTDSKMFTFHHVFSSESTQEEVYNAVARPIVENVLEGYNGTIFAYGQTGSGKTFTMEGQSSSELKGIIPNSFAQIFSSIAKAQEGQSYLVRCSYLEIYNENIRDLLCKDETQSLELKENKDKEVYVKDLTSLVVVDADDMDRVMMVGNKNRSVASTNMNSVSSRSHAIFSIVVECSTETGDDQRTLRMGKLNLVDLAGSERVRKTLATGDRLKEATKINLSLSNLGNVISALVDGSSYIPYRNSKLTRLLQDSLGGNSKTVMVATIGPADFNFEETVSTLRYSTRAKHIRNCAKINEDPKDAILRQYQEEILRLRTLLEQKKHELQNRSVLPPKRKKVTETKSEDSIDDRIGTLLEEQKKIEQKHKDELRALLEPYGIKAEGSQQEILDDLERRRAALMKDGAVVKEENERLFEELQQATDAMINSKRQCKELFHRVMSLESQLQKSLQAGEELRSKEQELAEQRRREENLRKTLELKKLTSNELKKELSKLQDEIEKKQKTLNTLNEKKVEYVGKAQNVRGLHGRNLKELQDLKSELTKEFKLKKLIMDNFIPRKILKKLEARMRYDEIKDRYVLAPRDDLTFEQPPVNRMLPGPFINLTRFKKFPTMSNVFFSDENLIAVEPDPPVPRSQELVMEEEDPVVENYIAETMRELNQEVVIICDHRKGKHHKH